METLLSVVAFLLIFGGGWSCYDAYEDEEWPRAIFSLIILLLGVGLGIYLTQVDAG